MKTYTHEEMLDSIIGKKGTKARQDYDDKVRMLTIGEAIRKTRIEKKMSQEKLGKLIGVKRAQISRIEHGNNLSLNAIAKIFSALEIKADIVTDNGLSIAIC